MDLVEYVSAHINASIDTKLKVLEQLPSIITDAGTLLAQCINNGHKILCCGNGGSAADAQHFSAELLGRYLQERRGLPAIALNTDTSTLTAVGNDYGYDYVFARQVEALGQAGDALIAISTSGNSPNIIAAIKAAREKKMHIIALTGRDGGKIATMLSKEELNVCVPGNVTAHIQETHIMILHCFCAIIDMHCIKTEQVNYVEYSV